MQRIWPGLTCLILCGCIPYVMPSLVLTKPFNLAELANEVRVFRVDVSSKYGGPCYDSEEYSLSGIPLIAGVVPPQVQPELDKGIIIIGVALNYHFHYHDGIHVRLYRPGFALVQFKSWEFGKKVIWQSMDFAGQEKAIDDLLANCGTASWGFDKRNDKPPWRIPLGLRPGSWSKNHHFSLDFAATEYERLAGSNRPDCSEKDRRRLLDKAEKVRELMYK